MREAGRPSELILILGGARSGKSAAAEQLAPSGSRVLFVATAEPLDEAMRQRIQAHRRHRPDHWDTAEIPMLHQGDELRSSAARYDTFIVDCLTLWISNLMLSLGPGSDADVEAETATSRLLDLMAEEGGRWILVSNEVGQGIVPNNPLGREYRDVLGRVNQQVASRADQVLLMVAGLPIDLKSVTTPLNR
ncbi:MAG: bifunctional adenosylcobinamide kinase/adenosylcobinamide-phosphate guanylyltransferase [Acidimicrobiia bacterium]|nr:bifunctional adenosylcobinamide kinase/adenosylcobinamide-phosphate guanylyltransferase [bacterium]MXX64330.1 bifunctional adenosylcobinamide kinase/adenosylcobinamide-phosphate guanylyltransferase [Acidimicrobiia bacterium]MCY3580222.1 bifunctional adenosylcobinamide kinase/adenosylcobinamide-phosphate guanylyltransferase [bacterium]MCY3651763.1 bifunctional adenosylcobinamide kinase/adenosylcobinamide-phosphate guanylyltransferase [bacterium]MDE0643513.1 bifunctional adenosylcobinamide kin